MSLLIFYQTQPLPQSRESINPLPPPPTPVNFCGFFGDLEFFHFCFWPSQLVSSLPKCSPYWWGLCLLGWGGAPNQSCFLRLPKPGSPLRNTWSMFSLCFSLGWERLLFPCVTFGFPLSFMNLVTWPDSLLWFLHSGGGVSLFNWEKMRWFIVIS